VLNDKIAKLRSLIQKRDEIDAEIETITTSGPAKQRGRPRNATRNSGEAETDGDTQVEASV
jgi:hypothetical protein